MLIYQILPSGELGDNREISFADGCPVGWTRKVPPLEIPTGQVALWNGADWRIADPVTASSDQIAARRYEVENGGVTVPVSTGTYLFDTSRENRSMWLAVRLEATANPTLEQEWKPLGASHFVILTNADILAVCEAVYAHVAACFAHEKQLLSNPPALSALDEGWPPN